MTAIRDAFLPPGGRCVELCIELCVELNGRPARRPAAAANPTTADASDVAEYVRTIRQPGSPRAGSRAHLSIAASIGRTRWDGRGFAPVAHLSWGPR